MDINGSFTHVFDDEGTFPYYCDVHTNMIGKVIVEARETTEPKIATNNP